MIVQARETFFMKGRRVVEAGACFDSEHPTVLAMPHLFVPVEFEAGGAGAVESASAAPGEKRSARRVRKSTPPDSEG